MIVPPWFLFVSGFSLVVLGSLQIGARPHQKGDGLFKRFVNVGTLWSLVCVGVGVGLLLMALGWWTPDFVLRPRQLPRHRA